MILPFDSFFSSWILAKSRRSELALPWQFLSWATIVKCYYSIHTRVSYILWRLLCAHTTRSYEAKKNDPFFSPSFFSESRLKASECVSVWYSREADGRHKLVDYQLWSLPHTQFSTEAGATEYFFLWRSVSDKKKPVSPFHFMCTHKSVHFLFTGESFRKN